MNLENLNFDSPENCCQSLRMLAELARQGEITVRGAPPTDAGGDSVMRVTVIQRGKRK